MEQQRDIIRDFKEIFKESFKIEGRKRFWITGFNQHVISNPDESRVDMLIVNFRGWPTEDTDEEIEQYENESATFEKHFIEQVQEINQIKLQNLNDNGHYFHNNNGDTISVHFNDDSLIYIETYTGQY